MRITTTGHDSEWIEQQRHGLKHEGLSSGISFEGFGVLLLSSVLGYKDLLDPTNCSRVLFFPHPLFLEDFSHYISSSNRFWPSIC